MVSFSKKLGIVFLVSVGSVFGAKEQEIHLSLLNDTDQPFGETVIDLSSISLNSSDSGNTSGSEVSASHAQLKEFFSTSEGQKILRKVIKGEELFLSEQCDLKEAQEVKEPGKFSKFCGQCAAPFKNVWGKYNGALNKTTDWFVKHPKVFAATDLATSLGMCVFANSYWFTDGTVFSIFATHLAAKSVNRNMPKKIGAPISLALYGAAAYGFIQGDIALDKKEVNDSMNDNWVFQPGLAKASTLAGLLVVDNVFAETAKDINKKN